jgi:CYTH domain-containing protein
LETLPLLPLFLVFSKNENMPLQNKYARIERERRFLLDQFPGNAIATRVNRITDSYIDGTTLRLREMKEDGGPTVFKLTQKIPARASGAQQGFITNIYLTSSEFSLFAQLPARKLSKIRYSVPPFGIDVFQDNLNGLLIAEAEFDSAVDVDKLTLPSFILHEVTTDERFTGGHLVQASRQNLKTWLSQYGIDLEASSPTTPPTPSNNPSA